MQPILHAHRARCMSKNIRFAENEGRGNVWIALDKEHSADPEARTLDARSRRTVDHDARQRCAIGTRRPVPKATVVILRPIAAWRRLYSARSIIRAIF